VYSKPVAIETRAGQAAAVKLTLDQVAKEPVFRETENVKLMDIESKLISQFHGRPVRMKAGVILPPSFETEKDRKYPVVYEVPGFGGNHFMALGMARRKPWDLAGTEAIWVVLDPNCRLGHHVFADSANNGPCGQALVEELIPAIESKYRGLGKPGARLVTGHSSGGWSSLWLQVTYPDVFGGCWSTSPDPVDFRDFQRIDLYNPGSNMFVDSTGAKRPLGRRGVVPMLFYKPFSDMEVVMGRGGQLGSFEAVFSPKGDDGKPVELWDRKTGAIRTDVAKAWEKYDIRLVLERNWQTLGPKLKGKIHVWMGDEDTFYLEGAARLLKESLATLGSDAVVEMFPGKNHGLVDQKLHERMRKEMAEAIRKTTPKPATEDR
jgi:S-formylglutathione hydrolase FrmB